MFIKDKKGLKIASMLSMLLLVGCGNSGDEEIDSGVSSDGETVVVEFFNQKPETTRQLEELAQTFSEENENVQIEITTIGSGEGAAGLQAKFTSNNAPAIMMLGGTSEIQRYRDTLVDMGDLEVVDSMLEDLLIGGNINDTQLALPMNIEGFGWMYNKEIFEQAGIDAEAIETYNDFVNAVETLESQKEDLGLEAVFGFSGAENYIANQFAANFTSPEYNHSTMDAYESTELNWEYGDRMQMYTDLLNEYNAQPILSIDYSRSVEDLFVNESVAMVHQGNWIVPTLNGIDPEFVENKLGILPVFGESDTDGRIVSGAPWYIGVNSQMDQEVIDVSIDFINWMYLSDEGQRILVEEMKYIPPLEGYDVENITDPVSQTIYQSMLDGTNAAMTHNQMPNGWFQAVLFPEYQQYLDGGISWEEFEENTSAGFTEMREQDNSSDE